MVPIADLRSAGPTFDGSDIEWITAAIGETLRSGVLTQGPYVRRLEEAFAERCGTAHAVAISNGTAALELILRALGVEHREVVVPTNTFMATANAVAFAGGRPTFADLDPATLCVGIDDVRRVVTPRTIAVVVVHIAGLVSPDMAAIQVFCRDRGLALVEDAAHAHGAMLGTQHAGALGDAASFSFFPTKPMTSGEGGMITTDREDVAEFARRYRSHGVDPRTRLHTGLGHNDRLPEVSAIIGLRQLVRLDEHLARRRAVAAVYDAAFAGTSLLAIGSEARQRHSYYKYPLLVATRELRDRMAVELRERGIPTGDVYYPPCHMQPFARIAYADGIGPLPKAEDVLPRVLCLPMHASLSQEEAGSVAEAVLAVAGDVAVA